MQLILQLREVGVPAFAELSAWAGLKVLDRAGYLLSRLRDVHETLGCPSKLRNRIVEDSLHNIVRPLNGEHCSTVDLERRFYLLASRPTWQPACSPLGGDVTGFGSFGAHPMPALASLEDGTHEKGVAGCKEDEDRVDHEGQGNRPPREGQREEDASDRSHEQARRTQKCGSSHLLPSLGREAPCGQGLLFGSIGPIRAMHHHSSPRASRRVPVPLRVGSGVPGRPTSA